MKTHASAVVCFALLAFVISANAYPRSESVLTENNDEVEYVKDNDSGINIKTVEPVVDVDENSKVSYSGAQLWKVDLNNDVTKYVLGGLRDRKEISPWGGTLTSIDILVHPKYQTHVEKVFSQSNITYEISIHDIQRAIDTENPLPNEDDELANRKGHRMTWSAYHRVVDINGYLDYLAITYPSLCTVKTIGSSVEGRQIKVLKVSNGKPGNKAVWIDGGMHAREWISPATVTYIINQFVENYDTETEDVKNLDWYFAPVMNPDGYEYSHTTDRLWRKNRSNKSNQCLGTDLNRNFGYKWGGKGSSKNPCTEIYGGSGPFSEPETTALRNFILNSGANFKSYISFHSYGQYILYPWGYDRVVPPDYSDLKIVAQKAAQLQLKETKHILEENESSLNKQSFGIQQELDATIEDLKDTKEQNTVLQVQLANLTKTHQELRVNYEDLLASKKNLEIRIAEIDTNFLRCKSELVSVKDNNDKLSDSETNLKKQLEIEKLQSKTARLQNEKDAKCILDLNRQVKEMERIIQRKHPDSVSALIVASKNELDSPTARSLLENRIKQLENEASLREMQSNNVFSEIQDKFNQMKAKYESHIEDLETHVNDLKRQLRTRVDTYDIYTQTYTDEPKLTDNNVKEIYNIGTQTEYTKSPRNVAKKDKLDPREDAHLIATIRGLQFDLTSKEKLINKMHKEVEEMRKTNRKLQRDREGNLKTVPDKRDNNKNDKQYNKTPDTPDSIDKELRAVREERDKIKAHLCRLEDDYQTLKTKRLQDLNTLQEAHEREITTYMSNTGPMREQLDVQQISISTLQSQLANAKEELAIITVERDHLDARLKNLTLMEADRTPEDCTTQLSLQKKIAYLERRYEEREHRLRAIVHGLAQKQVTTSRDCTQCAARQQQLISYKAELDQLLATLRYLQ